MSAAISILAIITLLCVSSFLFYKNYKHNRGKVMGQNVNILHLIFWLI